MGDRVRKISPPPVGSMNDDDRPSTPHRWAVTLTLAHGERTFDITLELQSRVRGEGPSRLAMIVPSPEPADSYLAPPGALAGGTSQAGGGGKAMVAPVGFWPGGIRSRFLCVTGGRLLRYDAMATASSSSRMDE